MTAVRHRAIAASAGSGKTFQLAHRYIRLMAEGVSPDRIIALTFSRKAAGEIFEYIVTYLGEAAASENGARRTAERIEKAEYSRRDFLRLLRELADNIHRLRIGTLDSFAVGIVRAFPMELGIGSRLEIIDEAPGAAGAADREVLERLFNPRLIDRRAQRAFLEAFRLATYGQEEKDLMASLDEFLSAYRILFLHVPDGRLWGSAEAVWGVETPAPWLTPNGDPAAAGARLQAWLEREPLSAPLRASLQKLVEFAAGYDERAQWDRTIEGTAVFSQLLRLGDALAEGAQDISYAKKSVTIPARQAADLLIILRNLIGTELRKALHRTAGIHRLIEQYERQYDALVRRRGRLTFTDVQYLLTERNPVSGGAVLSRDPAARLYIDYRLDGHLDHWLLDEFQDTSDLQWEVLRNLADEILQDSSGQRTFFYVGDVKQAIYGWRGGNPHLFGQILCSYPDTIEVLPLNTSFRSGRPVIDTVNAVFGALQGELPPAAADKWRTLWQPHTCAPGKAAEPGYAALLEPPRSPEGGKPGAADRYELAAQLLRVIQPLARGLSVAVLVRTNDSGKEVVDTIRHACPGMPVAHEGKAAIADNPVVAVLLALVKYAAHPADTLAWRHLEMSPLAVHLRAANLDRAALAPALLQALYAGGFEELVREWGGILNRVQPLDAFGGKRLADLLDVAAAFDRRGSRDVDEFLRFVEGYALSELAGENAVRVMTVHQAKGLGFDVVLLPDLQSRSIAGETPDVLIGRDRSNRAPRWVLKMPRRSIALADRVLAQQIAETQAEDCFEELCVLYVALTRPKRALYMITSYPGPAAKTLYPASILKQQLAGDAKTGDGPRVALGEKEYLCLYETGQRNWFTDVKPAPEPPPAPAMAELPADYTARPSLRRVLKRIEPSGQTAEVRKAGWLFAADTQDVLDFGSAIHDLFARVTWAEECRVEEVLAEWHKTTAVSAAVRRDVAEQFRRALAVPAVATALAKPPGTVELWREKRFEIVIADEWISGAFDRVVIRRDRDGQARRAEIVDFKSDRIAGEAEMARAADHHAGQITLYGRVLCRILGLAPADIALRLLFTRPARVWPVAFDAIDSPADSLASRGMPR